MFKRRTSEKQKIIFLYSKEIRKNSKIKNILHKKIENTPLNGVFFYIRQTLQLQENT